MPDNCDTSMLSNKCCWDLLWTAQVCMSSVWPAFEQAIWHGWLWGNIIFVGRKDAQTSADQHHAGHLEVPITAKAESHCTTCFFLSQNWWYCIPYIYNMPGAELFRGHQYRKIKWAWDSHKDDHHDNSLVNDVTNAIEPWITTNVTPYSLEKR